MDPNTLLTQLRQTADAAIGNEDDWPDEIREFFEGFRSLDEWLSKQGFLPDAWLRTSPAFGVDAKLDKLFHDTFITALEGGIGYWAASTTYHWTKDGTLKNADLEGFYSDIVDAEDDEDPAFEPVRIDRAVIARGFDRLLAGAEPDLHPRLRGGITAGYYNPDDADIDADGADIIVQMGLFGTVIYA